MQGAFSEMDDDIGWNDFALRNYDPQIGRWVQIDPFADDYISSPYVGMGNDPINTIDPSGGNIFQGVSLAGRIASGAIIGAVAAGVFDAATGRDNLIDGAIGTVLGAVIGGTNVLTATKVAIQVANTATTIINTSITAQQAGNTANGTNVLREGSDIMYAVSRVNQDGGPSVMEIRTAVIKLYEKYSGNVEMLDAMILAAELSYRIKAVDKREEADRMTRRMSPTANPNASGGAGASGGWIPKFKEKPFKDRTLDPLEVKRNKALEDAKKYDDIAEALRGVHQALEYLTVKGLGTLGSEKVIEWIIEKVRDKYNNSTEKEKKEFNLKDAVKGFFDQAVKNVIKNVRQYL